VLKRDVKLQPTNQLRCVETTTTHLTALHPGEPVPEETFTHSHPVFVAITKHL